MTTNPMFGNKIGPSKGTDPKNPVNNDKRSLYQGRNTFDYSRRHFLTARYADITPFECLHGVEGDVFELGSRHSIRSHTLKSPLMSPIHMKKTYVQVDMKAILPNNWNKFYINPTVGDDVVAEDVNTYISQFFLKFNLNAQLLGVVFSSALQTANEEYALNLAFHYLMVYESIFSAGSILNLLGCHSSAMYKNTTHDVSFDVAVEELISQLQGNIQLELDYTTDNISTIVFEPSNYRDLLSCIRYNHGWKISLVADDDTGAPYNACLNAFAKFFSEFSLSTSDEHMTPLNYDVLCAYQIACASFYSRDQLDDVYNAETYRDNMDYLIQLACESTNTNYSQTMSFEWNGKKYFYDALSGKACNFIIDSLFNAVRTEEILDTISDFYPYYYFMNLFGFNRSLRYGDYFIGGRSRPLAVGDVTAEVGADGVNAIDMVVALARARFLNDENRIGRRPEDYIEDLMDGQLPPEITEPRRLVTLTHSVSGFEVENTTSVEQGNIVTVLKSSDSKHVYSISIGHPCIVLGLLSYEIPRIYSKTIDRFFFHENRFDMFNKYLQKIGDQKILRAELNAEYDSNIEGSAYAYTLRHMEYKQRFPIASGGFVGFLPGYAFITDSDENAFNIDDWYLFINSDYVRSSNREMDQFYSSLTNFSLAGYFHFILSMDNICIAHRKMDYSPSIL